MTRPALLVAALLMSVAFPAHADQDVPTRLAHGDFVRVDGDHFVVDGKPFYFVGANLSAIHGEPSRSHYRETLSALAGDGLRVGRIWAFGEGPTEAGAWFRANELFRAGPAEFLEGAYVQLDRVVAEAGARGLRLIITLANNWSDYGGIPMYLRWAGLPPGADSDDPAREAFYSDERVRRDFRAGVLRLIGRTNTVSGLRYADDPTILSWELMNESTVISPDGATARRAWIAEMARLIKSLDPHHLVGAGLYGYGSRTERGEWIRVHRLPDIDYCDSHLYPEGADLIAPPNGPRARDARKRTTVLALAERRLEAFLDDRAQLARFVIGKPLVIGEFGFRTDRQGAAGTGFLGAERAGWFRRLLDRSSADGVAGALAWIYQPWAGTPRDFGIYVDRPDTDDVREVLRSAAALAARGPTSTNPRLSAAAGDGFMYEPLTTIAGRAAPHARWSDEAHGALLEIPPAEFSEARFEKAGAAGSQIWGAGWGHFRYRYAAPAGAPPRRVRIEARLSAEWPGNHGPVGGTSLVRLLVDGERVAEREVITDDGVGRKEAFVITNAATLRRLGAGPHTIDFEVPDAQGAHGLCIYGSTTTSPKIRPTRVHANEKRRATPIRVIYERPSERSPDTRSTTGLSVAGEAGARITSPR